MVKILNYLNDVTIEVIIEKLMKGYRTISALVRNKDLIKDRDEPEVHSSRTCR
jgi:hypothetical protein